MLGFIKSVGNKAISSIPKFNSKTKINTPQDNNLQQKLKQISSQILKTQSSEQFKIYQQLQSPQNSDFNRNLRLIYQHEGCTTQTINSIIRFYTFLLTNCKNELVICKLVSEPLVIELTKIVLQINEKSYNDELQMMTSDCLQNNQNQEQRKQQQIPDLLSYVNKLKQLSLVQSQDSQQGNNEDGSRAMQQQIKDTIQIKSLHYLSDIDWDQVNAYKVALIRSYINCINAQTIKYMIIENELPIFVNCINGYKHYLSEGVQGTCLSNCILMILTKVNHNDQVCQIIFDSQHHYKTNISLINQQNNIINKQLTNINRQSLSKSISNQKSIKLHVFVKQVIKKISVQIKKVLYQLNEQIHSKQGDIVSKNLKQYRKLDMSMQFIQSNILFCVDLINSINNYNYTTKIKSNIGQSIQTQLIAPIISYVNNQQSQSTNIKNNHQQQNNYNNQEKQNNQQINQKKSNISNNQFYLNGFQLVVLKLIRFVLNLSITCQKQLIIIQFLNQNSSNILQTLISLNQSVFNINSNQNTSQQINQIENIPLPSSKSTIATQIYSKQCLTYICNYSIILLKQTISPYSKLASRKRLQFSHQILQLKQNILSKIFILLQQITKNNELKQGICFKTIRNLLLCDKCSISPSSPQKNKSLQKKQLSQQKKQQSPQKKHQSPQKKQQQIQKSNKSIQKSNKSEQKGNLGLILQFKYSILLLHKIYCQQFKKIFVDNKNWQYIVNNYQLLMRQIPNTILSVQQNDKYCHYHNGNNYQDQDKIRDIILICQTVRNYRYMIIHQTKLQDKLIRLENIYHKHFMSPGWNYYPGQIIHFNSNSQYKVVCVGFLHNNNLHKLPIQIIQDFQCLLISHKVSQHNYKIIANIRYKKIHSFVPQGKNLIRMKLIGIQQLILEFSAIKVLGVFKQYLNENRNKTRQKQLKFINYYLNMYLKDSQKLIQQIYNQQLIGLDNNDEQEQNNSQNNKYYQNKQINIKNQYNKEQTKYNNEQTKYTNPRKKLSLQNIQTLQFQQIQQDQIPQQNINIISNSNIKQPQQLKQSDKFIYQSLTIKQNNLNHQLSINNNSNIQLKFTQKITNQTIPQLTNLYNNHLNNQAI